MLLTGTKATPAVFSATCTAAESVGDFVTTTGPGTVATIDIDAQPTQIPDGVVIAKPTATICLVQYAGIASVSGVVAGSSYFVGTSGQAQVGPPSAPGSGKRAVHYVGRGVDSNRLQLIQTKPTIILP